MHTTTLTLPDRDSKPRTMGMTMVIDTGMPTHYFSDVVSSFSGQSTTSANLAREMPSIQTSYANRSSSFAKLPNVPLTLVLVRP